MNIELYLRMVEKASEIIEECYPQSKEHHLVSGGAAFSDHIAVSLMKQGDAEWLTLHLPCPWDFENSCYQENGLGGTADPGRTANYYHRQFSKAMGYPAHTSLDSIGKLLLADSEVGYTVSDGFHARNILTGQVDLLIVFTWGEGNEPKDGGTLHCWRNSIAPRKIHIPLHTLEVDDDDEAIL